MITTTEAFAVESEDATKDAAEGKILKRGLFERTFAGTAAGTSSDGGHDLINVVLGNRMRLTMVSYPACT